MLRESTREKRGPGMTYKAKGLPQETPTRMCEMTQWKAYRSSVNPQEMRDVGRSFHPFHLSFLVSGSIRSIGFVFLDWFCVGCFVLFRTRNQNFVRNYCRFTLQQHKRCDDRHCLQLDRQKTTIKLRIRTYFSLHVRRRPSYLSSACPGRVPTGWKCLCKKRWHCPCRYTKKIVVHFHLYRVGFLHSISLCCANLFKGPYMWTLILFKSEESPRMTIPFCGGQEI